MASTYMPEAVSSLRNDQYAKAVGWDSSQCNGLAYNPATTYTPPKTPTGAIYPTLEANATHGSDAPETAAFEIGYFFSGLELLV